MKIHIYALQLTSDYVNIKTCTSFFSQYGVKNFENILRTHFSFVFRVLLDKANGDHYVRIQEERLA